MWSILHRFTIKSTKPMVQIRKSAFHKICCFPYCSNYFVYLLKRAHTITRSWRCSLFNISFQKCSPSEPAKGVQKHSNTWIKELFETHRSSSTILWTLFGLPRPARCWSSQAAKEAAKNPEPGTVESSPSELENKSNGESCTVVTPPQKKR